MTGVSACSCTPLGRGGGRGPYTPPQATACRVTVTRRAPARPITYTSIHRCLALHCRRGACPAHTSPSARPILHPSTGAALTTDVEVVGLRTPHHPPIHRCLALHCRRGACPAHTSPSARPITYPSIGARPPLPQRGVPAAEGRAGARRIIVTPFAVACGGDWCHAPLPTHGVQEHAEAAVMHRAHSPLQKGVRSTPSYRNTIRRSLRRRLVSRTPPHTRRAGARRRGGNAQSF